ncbi:LysR family transcriptional regulator [Acidisoma cellulosilytica]|uniref:LysR family transcriptional regulator n=1 Tax=Acidisoma cellulosilyticum TaxID=2802395 RepID=A0A964E5L7_9PROT|nr:LysR family transcriptional regulator [Acidisoma cellulosilyticum]MCB8882108.1 LysR family transcriptional regulator [Acidisoma cellulosilyticum]
MANHFQGQLGETDLRLLRVFHAVAEKGGFAAAEVSLGKTKSAVSADVSALETRLGVTLCARGRGGFALTIEGRQVLEAVEALFADLDNFRDRMNQARGRLSGTLTLHVTDNIVTYEKSPLLRVVGRFAALHPEVFIQLVSGAASEVEQAVMDGRATIGVSVLPRLVATLDATPLFQEVLHLYCGRDHPLFSTPASAITPEEIGRHRMVEVSAGATGPLWPIWREQLTFSARAGTIDARAILLLSGAFLGFLPPAYAETWTRQGLLRALAPERLHLSNMFHVLTRRGTPGGLIAETFKTLLIADYAKEESTAPIC